VKKSKTVVMPKKYENMKPKVYKAKAKKLETEEEEADDDDNEEDKEVKPIKVPVVVQK